MNDAPIQQRLFNMYEWKVSANNVDPILWGGCQVSMALVVDVGQPVKRLKGESYCISAHQCSL
jgi:hypothetical protein